MNVEDFEKQLKELNVCSNAQKWAPGKTRSEAWQQCKRADWMLWYLAKTGYDRKLLAGLACDCAETVLKYVPQGEDRPKIAIEITRKWIKGEATINEVEIAAVAAYDAAAAYVVYAATVYATAYAAIVAAYAADAAAYAADVVVDDAVAAAYAAVAAAYAVDADDTATTKRTAHKIMCKMIRKKVRFE